MALAALVLLGACNDKENRPVYTFVGSQENGRALILPNGTTATPVSGAELIPALPEGRSRSRMMAMFYVKGNAPAKQWWNPPTGIEIDLLSYGQFRTEPFSFTGTAEADDPILFPVGSFFLDPGQVPALSSLEPGVFMGMNYLNMTLAYRTYMKDMYTPREATPVLEIDEVIVPGPSRDTINMALKFDSNRASDDEFDDTQLIFSTVAFDLEEAAETFGFPTTNSTGGAKTYIIKMAYTTFAEVDDPQEDELVTRYETIEWTPAEPYDTETE